MVPFTWGRSRACTGGDGCALLARGAVPPAAARAPSMTACTKGAALKRPVTCSYSSCRCWSVGKCTGGTSLGHSRRTVPSAAAASASAGGRHESQLSTWAEDATATAVMYTPSSTVGVHAAT